MFARLLGAGEGKGARFQAVLPLSGGLFGRSRRDSELNIGLQRATEASSLSAMPRAPGSLGKKGPHGGGGWTFFFFLSEVQGGVLLAPATPNVGGVTWGGQAANQRPLLVSSSKRSILCDSCPGFGEPGCRGWGEGGHQVSGEGLGSSPLTRMLQ